MPSRTDPTNGTALPLAEEAADTFRRLRDHRNEAYCAGEVATNLYHLADFPTARARMLRAVALHRDRDQWRGEANGLGVLGMINRATGDYAEARDRLSEALRIY